jgi:uncharacterized protein YcbX
MLTVSRICRYPVKGLSAEDLSETLLVAGAGLRHDREFAIAHGSSRFESAEPGWRSKDHFLMLMRDERLALLHTEFEDESGVLAIYRDGKQVARGNLRDPLGRRLVEQFLAAFLAAEARGTPKIVAAPDVSFTDTRENYVSIINLASVTDIERVVRQPVDPIRFRGNIYVGGAEPWQEMQWPGKRLQVGDALLEAVDTIERCAATNVNPKTGERDLNLPKSLMDGFRHADCGVCASVVEGGRVSVGDRVEPA